MFDTFFKTDTQRSRMGMILMVLGAVLALFVAMKFINEIRGGASSDASAANLHTIDVSGEGDAYAVADIATESFGVEEKAASVADAQAAASKKVDAAIAFLKSAGVDEKDIKTINYSAYPDYSYPQPCYGGICTEVTKQPKIIGYTVSETISVKIRNTGDVGKIVDGLGKAGATNLSGPDFTIDNPDGVQAEARAKAIADAKEKAQKLAKDLGVHLKRIVHFTENTGGAYPLYAKDAAYGMGGAGAPAPQVPVGQNKYTSNVTITYEIR